MYRHRITTVSRRRGRELNLQEFDAVADLTVEEAVDELSALREKLEGLKRAEYLLYRMVLEGMEERGAKLIRTDTGLVARRTSSATYDYGKLAALREITEPEDLDRVYYPAHEETKIVPEKWNMAKGRKLGQLGNEHQAIIDAARVEGLTKIEIYEIGEESTR